MSGRLFERLLARDGVLVLERETRNLFHPRGTIPDWLGLAVRREDVGLATREPSRMFRFLEHFLEDAEAWWEGGAGGELRSEPWTESALDGEDLHLEASACVLGETGYLLVRHIEVEYERTHRALQIGRELSLAHEQLLTETSKKEILLHCIVHDLNGPLHGISGTFDLLKREELSPAGEKLLQLGQQAARQQASFIANMLDTFRAEVSSLETLATSRAEAPDIVAEAQSVMNALAPAFQVRGTTVRFVLTPGTPQRLPVVGERTRLERIFHNLLENALRHSPRGGQISLTISRDEAGAFVAVDDCGPGVEPGLASQLFEKFVRGEGKSGKVGLGLYFCRITVEQWGGKIGCDPRPEGGTRFWFRLLVP